MKAKQEEFISYTYNYINAEDYIKKYKINSNLYLLDNIKVYIFENFYVSINANGDESYIHDVNKNILLQSSPNKLDPDLPGFAINLNEKNIIELEEAVDLCLIKSYNYWHFIFTHLDKIVNFEENGYTGKYIVPNPKYIKELISLTGIPVERFVYCDGKQSCFFIKKLHVLDYCYLRYFNQSSFANPFTLKKIRNLILSNIDLSDISKYPKKLFVKRIGIRKIKNEHEVENFLNKYNFKIMIPENYSVEEQIKHFYAADVVVCAHGANSTNALFMRENTYFIESFGANFINPCMFDAIKANKLNYHMLVQRKETSNMKRDDISSDYNIDIYFLEIVINNIIKSPCKSYKTKL